MSNGWIAMPLNALAFALKLANVEQPSASSGVSGFEEVPALPFDIEGLTDEVVRQFQLEDERFAA